MKNIMLQLRIKRLWKHTFLDERREISSLCRLDINRCTELLTLIDENSKDPSIIDVLIRRGVSYAFLTTDVLANQATKQIYREKAMEDYVKAADIARSQGKWEEVLVCERYMRSEYKSGWLASLPAQSEKLKKLLDTPGMFSGLSNDHITETSLNKIFEFINDSDPELRSVANEVIALIPFTAKPDLMQCLISAYQKYRKSNPHYASRIARQFGRILLASQGNTDLLMETLKKFGIDLSYISINCARCSYLNSGIPIPPKRIDQPFSSQQEDQGAFTVPAICDRCGQEFFIVWN